MGTPDYAVPALDALVAAGHELVCVYSQPARRSGRGRNFEPSAVESRARALGLSMRTSRTLKSAEESAAFAALKADAAVVVAYGLILPRAVLAAPRLGCINAHASLLPRWRGAAPIERALMAGDTETGVTIMRMAEGLDTGPILLERRVPIAPDTTAGTLRERLALLSAELLLEALDGLARGSIAPAPQDETTACYAVKLTPADERLDWRRPAVELERFVRALNPRPGAHFVHRGERIKLWATEPTSTIGYATPGTVLDDGLLIACAGGSALRLIQVQRPGRKTMTVDALLRGYPISKGEVLECPAIG
ncbi:MAG: methionyl-tRNA formyltransferase [Alphaproteobacteria bacterium]|nr:methionyl-tRNA formyltransferase [Alphaproteobacteria bacterium]